MTTCPCIELQNGNKVPLVGLGTAATFDDVTQACVTCALDAGYRLIDTAAYYDNEIAVGKALKEKFLSSSLRREDVFVTTKVG
ncbi:unnamed protein product [Dibothriocephalus latus]|uniref:NADP-dependent oxidoreductase domain-containing protein n=1 Tax=Dibothriocephalus latus TaxID=60516 RepID=A0A3P7M323_DIBLA|nr:unnamed protein product [Dibothriocephalus latus]